MNFKIMAKEMEKKAKIERKTAETDISLTLTLESVQASQIQTGVPFFDHMLSSMTRHGRMSMVLSCDGDIQVDDHHSVEDTGICMGKAFRKSIGDRKGINRFGEAVVPMDEALSMCAVDLSGRGFFQYSGIDLQGYIHTYSEELTLEFLRSFAMNAELTLHVRLLEGSNRHHIHESIYKSLGIALYRAYSIDSVGSEEIPSTKGVL